MKHSIANSYQTYILFFSWTAALISVILRLFVKVELSQIMLAIVVLDIIVNIKKRNSQFNRYSFHVITLLLIFYGWLIVSNVYSPSMEYKFEKSFYFIANIIFFLYPFFIQRINFNLLIRLYCIVVLPLSVYFIYMKSILWSVNSSATELFMDIRGAYLIFGTQLAMLFLLLLYFNKNMYIKIITFLLLLATGARGPILILILLVFFYLFFVKKIKPPPVKNIIRTVFLFVVFLIVFLFNADIISRFFETSFGRFSSLLEGNDGSSLARLDMIRFAFYQPFEKLSTLFFGNGVGSFGIIYGRIDQRAYPHNILLECFFELGLIGLISLLLVFLSVFYKISFKKDIFSLLFICIFLNAMKSSSLIDLWVLFSLMGCMISETQFKNEILN